MYICSDEDFVNSETKLRVVPKTTVIFSHERSWNLNKKLSHQHRKVEGEVGNRAKTNFRDTRVIGQLHRERFRYSLVFVDVIRRRQSSRFAHWIMKEGPERWKRILDPRCFRSGLLGSNQGATLSTDPRDLRLDIPIDFKSPNVKSSAKRINQKYVFCIY